MTVRVADVLERLAEGPGTFRDGRRAWTGAQLCSAAWTVADRLRDGGARPGHVVAWPAGDAAACLVTELACLAGGLTAVPLPPGARTPAVRPDHLVHADAPEGDRGPGTVRPVAPDAAVGAKSTSGTTGPPKTVFATAAHTDHLWAGLDELFAIGRDDVLLAVLPPHVWLQRMLVLLSLAGGAQVVVEARPALVLHAARRVRPTIVQGVPAVLGAAHTAARGAAGLRAAWGGEIRSLWTGSAPTPPGVLQAYADAGVPVHEGYGTSETGMIAKGAPGRTRPGTVGRPFPGVEVTLDGGVVAIRCAALPQPRYADGTPLPGRLGPDLHRTADLGRLDADGFLRVDGRCDDVISLDSGSKIVPRLLEDDLSGLAEIVECAVVEDGTGRVRAVVVPAAGHPPGHVGDAVRRWALDRGVPVAPASTVLRRTAALPRTSSGELDRAAVRGIARTAGEGPAPA